MVLVRRHAHYLTLDNVVFGRSQAWPATVPATVPAIVLVTVTVNVGMQTDLMAIYHHGPDHVITTTTGGCYHREGCHATCVFGSAPNMPLRSGARTFRRCKCCMPDPRYPARHRRLIRDPEIPEPAAALLNCPATVTLRVLSMVGAHGGTLWTQRHHWEEA